MTFLIISLCLPASSIPSYFSKIFLLLISSYFIFRLSLRVPLVRLYQELETFRFRAVADTSVTVERMEKCRTDYRAGLLWMAEVSKELDPDVNKRLDKFRDVCFIHKYSNYWFRQLQSLVQFLKPDSS